MPPRKSRTLEATKEVRPSKRARPTKQTSMTGITSTAASANPVSEWSIDRVCMWLKSVLDSKSAEGLFNTEEKDRLVNYFQEQRINGCVLLGFTEADRAALLKEAVPAQRGPQSFLNKEIQNLIESSCPNVPDKASGLLLIPSVRDMDSTLNLSVTGRKRTSPRVCNESSNHIDDHFRSKKSAFPISSVPKGNVLDAIHEQTELVPSVQLVVSAEDWFKRTAEQTRKIKDARSKFQEELRNQNSCCELIERSVGDLRRLLSEAVGPKKYTDPKPWNKQLDLMDEHFQERQKLSNIIVVGDTGAGKSSLLNAILDEWSVLPTNCSGRACTGLPLAFFFFVKIVQYLGQKCADFAESDANTASVIELEYDADAAGKDQPYSATVEFVSKEDWHQELQTLAEEQEVRSANLPKSFLVRIFFRAHACLSPPQVDGEEAGEDETCNASQVSGTTAYAATSTPARIDADFN